MRHVFVQLTVLTIALVSPRAGLAQFGREGRPVSAKDIAGKKICWGKGHWIMFGAKGSPLTTKVGK
jgi:hypothetical protein